jgi:hypothetical protein
VLDGLFGPGWGDLKELEDAALGVGESVELEAVLGERMGGTDEPDAYRRLAAERDNLLTAANYAIDSADNDLAFRRVRHTPAPIRQLGFALYLPIPAILALPGAASHITSIRTR